MDQHHANDQHAPMSSNDDLAKALHDGLQFEETPLNGDAKDDSKADTSKPEEPTLPSLMPDPIDLPAPTLSSQPEEDLSSVHHGSKHKNDDKFADDDLAVVDAEEPQLPTQIGANSLDSDGSAPANDTSVASEPDSATAVSTGDPELDKLKASALEDLRPLVGKLNLPAEEKFDTLLLIIRTTDDHTLLQEAHDAAKQISDDMRRAQALLDIIKEIDYFASKR